MINNGASKQRLFTMALGPKNNDAFGFRHGIRRIYSANNNNEATPSPWRVALRNGGTNRNNAFTIAMSM